MDKPISKSEEIYCEECYHKIETHVDGMVMNAAGEKTYCIHTDHTFARDCTCETSASKVYQQYKDKQ